MQQWELAVSRKVSVALTTKAQQIIARHCSVQCLGDGSKANDLKGGGTEPRHKVHCG